MMQRTKPTTHRLTNGRAMAYPLAPCIEMAGQGMGMALNARALVRWREGEGIGEGAEVASPVQAAQGTTGAIGKCGDRATAIRN